VNNVKKLLIIILAFCLILTLISCSNKEKMEAHIRGEIIELTLNKDNNTISILVEGSIEQDTTYDKALVFVSDKAKVINSATGDKLKNDELRVGMKVEVTLGDSIRESYPIQADAKEVRVLDR
jgi:hypothetical protein